MHLLTERLCLRDLDARDAGAMATIEGDPVAVRYQSYPPRTLADCTAYLARDAQSRASDRACYDLAATLRGDDAMLGRLGLDVKLPERAVGELWFSLDRRAWGQGLMPEAARALVSFGFAQLGLRRVFLECDPRNTASRRLAAKLGMREEGCLRRHVCVKGEWCDSMFYGLLAEEWAAG